MELRRLKLQMINFIINMYMFIYLDKKSGKPARLRPQYTSVFTGNTKKNGMLYTSGGNGHMRLSKDERKSLVAFLKSDEELETTEIDYKSCYGVLGYHLLGIDYKKDIYDILTADQKRERGVIGNDAEKRHRDLVKMLFNPKLNDETGCNAVKACNTEMNKYSPDEDTQRRQQIIKDSLVEFGYCGPAKYTFAELDTAIEEAHPALKVYFDDGESGLKIQRVLADINLEICYQMALRNIPVLSLTDSFVTLARYQDNLKTAMSKVYKQYANGFAPIEPEIVF